MDKVTRAGHAQRLLEDEVLQAALDGVKEYHTATFRSATATDDDVLEARRALLAAVEFEARLRSFVIDGKIAEKRDQHRGSD